MIHINNMNRGQRLEMAIEKGYTCNPNTGDIFGPSGKKLSDNDGLYMRFGVSYKNKWYRILAHQFVWYYVNKNVADFIDHINRDKKDNRILNLRNATLQQNQFNKSAKGYSYNKRAKKYQAMIKVNYIPIHLGYFLKEDDARQAYLDAKKIYHVI